MAHEGEHWKQRGKQQPGETLLSLPWHAGLVHRREGSKRTAVLALSELPKRAAWTPVAA